MDANRGDLQWDIHNLVHELKQEKLFVSNEQNQLQNLNQQVIKDSEKLAQLAWVAAQQRLNLNRLIVARPDVTPAQCRRRSNSLQNTEFLPAHKVLNYQDCQLYGDFLQTLRISPELLGKCVFANDRVALPNIPITDILSSLNCGLYGSLLLPHDTILMLRLLKQLAILNVTIHDKPRILRQGSSSFFRLYTSFHEGLFSSKLFLTSTLQAPIMQLLLDPSIDSILDIDLSKAMMRFSDADRDAKFGRENTPEYHAKLAAFRKQTIERLVAVTTRFIQSLHENLHSFPTPLSWLIRQIYHLLVESNKFNVAEMNSIVTDLVFTHFICPAMVNPEPYGITDAPISYVARVNLIQIAQVIQMLALVKYQPVDEKLRDLYELFDKQSVSCILDVILHETETKPSSIELPLNASGELQGIARTAALFTQNELYNLINFLQKILEVVEPSGNEAAAAVANAPNPFLADVFTEPDIAELKMLLNPLPINVLASLRPEKITNGLATRNGDVASRDNSPDSMGRKAAGIITRAGLKTKPKVNKTSDSFDAVKTTNEIVLIIPLNLPQLQLVGMLSEQKVLSMETDETDANDETKRGTSARLSHSGSIGNISDNLEAISEAASNHSVASSIEMEDNDDNNNDNDNLSDMISANVSGRGSPNISGRDTPSSQVTEGGDNERAAIGNENARQQFLQTRNQSMINKQIRSEIDDKFCKFEIKKLIEGDETVSIISDTWSTDVLASDSETIEAAGNERLASAFALVNGLERPLAEMFDRLDSLRDTVSESAWSTDALASDSERMIEVDTDDTASVAPSDDTASVARSDDVARSEADDTSHRGSIHAFGAVINVNASISNSQPSSPGHNGLQSPNRADLTSSRTLTMQNSHNITGKGGRKSDYRRRTMEYVDSNGRSIAANAFYDTGILRNSNTKSLCENTNKREAILIDTNLISQNGMELLLEKGKLTNDTQASTSTPATNKIVSETEAANVENIIVRLSNVSLHSACSSGSSASSSEYSNKLTHNWYNAKNGNVNATEKIDESNGVNESIETNDGGDQTVNVVTPTLKTSAIIKSNGSVATGAIPKSISFDKTAEKGDKECDDAKKRGGFFGKIRAGFKNRRKSSLRDEMGAFPDVSVDGDTSSRVLTTRRNETSEDILAKYRTKSAANGDVATESDTLNSKLANDSVSEIGEEELWMIDYNNIESSYAFSDCKRKLRMVFNSASEHLSWNTHIVSELKMINNQPSSSSAAASSSSSQPNENELELFLRLELARARNLCDWPLAALISETLRCVALFNTATASRKLLHALKQDHVKRRSYARYLVRCRQELLGTLAHLQSLSSQVTCDCQLSCTHLVNVCVRMFLERRETQIQQFCDVFASLSVFDEKTDLLANFMDEMVALLDKDPNWIDASEFQLDLARNAIEQTLISRVYTNAFYPNGDGDKSRDAVLHEHICKLSNVITVTHKDLRIHKRYHYECPWQPAQEAIAAMGAYKTAKDKLRCVIRCTSSLMSLLSFVSDRCTPTADDFTPVLVYVLIKANPAMLLSTIEYVNNFYGDRLCGEDQYWWTQFCSAVEFIKTMDYSE